MVFSPRRSARIAFLGPEGTFCEEALLSDPDLRSCQLVVKTTIREAIRAVANGETEGAFVPVENSIAGAIEATSGELGRFEMLTIEREVVLNVHLALVGTAGASLDSIEQVISYPVALAECRRFLGLHLPQATIRKAHSTAEAARVVAARKSNRFAAVASSHAADVYGLEVLADSIEDHPDNTTRFGLVVPRQDRYSK
ncbi:MAG TPA: prephenate dehydratase domain-containing protein [Acidimicrobiales bacterium]|nr:prephenate dehydratase domain-containing protein [Acidimicrobiales bacterium]